MSNYLEKAKTQLMAQADYVSQSVADWQTIQDYLSNRVENIVLNKRQVKKLERYEFAYAQLMSAKYTEAEVLSMIEKKFNVKRSTAVADIQNSQEIFIVTLGINKLFKIKVSIERLEIQLAKAASKGMLAEYAMLEKVKQGYLKELPDENPDNNAQHFTRHINHFGFYPEQLGYGVPNPEEWKDVVVELEAKHKYKLDSKFIEDAILVENGDEDNSL